MKCVECGKELADDVKFCSNCGAKVQTESGFRIEKRSVVNTNNSEGNVVQKFFSRIKQKKQERAKVVFVNLANEGLFGTAGYWENGEVHEFPRKNYPKIDFNIDTVLNDAKTEAKKFFRKPVGGVVVGIPDIIKYKDLARYKEAVKKAGFTGYKFIRTTVAQAFAISYDFYKNHPSEELDFGIYNYVGGKLIGCAIEACEGVTEIKYVDFDDEKAVDSLKTDPVNNFCRTFCRKRNDGRYSDSHSWNVKYIGVGDPKHIPTEEEKIERANFTKTIYFNENCSELQNYIMQLDGTDKKYITIGKGKMTNTGLALQAAILNGEVKDDSLLDASPFKISIYLDIPQKDNDEMVPGDVYRELFNINKDTTIPTKKSCDTMRVLSRKLGYSRYSKDVPLSTLKDNQSSMKFKLDFFDSDDSVPFEITNIPQAPAGTPKIDLLIDIDINLDITVTGKVLDTDIFVKKVF